MEGKSRGPEVKLILLISSSLFLNVLFGCYIYLFAGNQISSGWSSPAAVEAEAVAAISCSGHGRAYLDSVIDDGKPTCECNTCYAGKDCSLLLWDCPADADSGDPLFLEPYWQRNAAGSAVLVAGWHRMSYQANGDSFISLELERHLRLLHDAVGNAVTRNRFIVFGAGSTQLINAAVYALSSDAVNINDSSSPALVVATAPFYRLYKLQTKLFDSRENIWEGVTANLANLNASSGANFIEFVTSPNNPDGMLKGSVIRGSSVIYDHSYYWPHYTAIPSPAGEGIMLFTISKVTGHAGSRFGWALVKDKEIYNKMVHYLLLNTMGVSRDTQLRILKLLKVILAQVGREGDIFKFSYETVNEKWTKLSNIVSSSSRFSLQKLLPQYCTYFHKIRDPSPAYAWVKCEREEDTNCEVVLREAGIISRAGKKFEAENRYTRLSLSKQRMILINFSRKWKPLFPRESAPSDARLIMINYNLNLQVIIHHSVIKAFIINYVAVD